ncbi:MAG TPA: alpha-L-glutamate ligase [Vicinamibacteria bacterium]|nr:alpha-L-glutamate ligase [Vicinamibacteria bacterium]
MSRIHVIHENAEWTAPLFEELDNLGLPYEDWSLIEGRIHLDHEPPDGVFYNRMSASSHTRGHRYSPEYAGAVLAWLESHGRRVSNTGRALQLELSKAAQSAALRAFGIPTPRTIAAIGRRGVVEAAHAFDNAFITKHNRGGKGLGVRLFRTREALASYVEGPEFEPSPDGITLVQQYVQAPAPFITRCEFVGGEFLYAVRVDTSDGFQLCPADACDSDDRLCPASQAPRHRFEILDDFDHPFLPMLRRFLGANGIDMGGVELIEDKQGRSYVYDVNTNTNYNEDAERRAGKERLGMRSIARYLGEELARVQGEPSIARYAVS